MQKFKKRIIWSKVDRPKCIQKYLYKHDFTKFLKLIVQKDDKIIRFIKNVENAGKFHPISLRICL